MTSLRTLAGVLATVLLCSSMAGCLDTLTGNDPPTAVMSTDPSENIKTGDSVTFSAVGSSDPDGDSMTFTWTFGDGNTGTGLTTSHSYAQPGDYTVRLAVGDGSHEATASMTVTILDSSAREPHAEITAAKDDDCEGEDPPGGDFVLIWVCDDDKDINDREVSVSTTVTLDGPDEEDVEVGFDGRTLFVRAPKQAGFMARNHDLEVVVTLPRSSTLVARLGSADLDCDGALGRTEVRSGSGDVGCSSGWSPRPGSDGILGSPSPPFPRAPTPGSRTWPS